MSGQYDCIVLGVGGFGSAALYHAAARGLRVLGLEQFSVAHDRGSSHGETRIIRKAYFEHPDYVPLLVSAYELWRQLEAERGCSLMHLCGLMLAGPPEGEAIAGAQLASRLHDVPLETVAPREAQRRYSGFRFPQSFQVMYEPEAGYLEVEACVRAHVDAALARGAVLSTDEVVHEWQLLGNTVRVRTSKNQYQAAALVITAGPWASQLLHGLALPLEIVRKPVFWFPAKSAASALDAHAATGRGLDEGAPTFFFEMPFGQFYGFPSLDGRTVKVAEHTGGQAVADPLRVERRVSPADSELLARFVRECMPQLDPEPTRNSVCMYTLTPDRHFIVDRHPTHAPVVFGAGFSGHGFKFTPVIGQALIELATEGRSRHPIGFLSASREALIKASAGPN
jgi:sarcosine oxidase